MISSINRLIFSYFLQGCEVQDIIEYSQKVLEDVISSLSEIIIHCHKTLLSHQQILKNTSIDKNFKTPVYDKNMSTMSALVKTFKTSRPTSSNVSVGIGYSSRHFSPFSSKTEVKTKNEFETQTSKNVSENLICVNSKTKEEMHSLIKKLSHGETDFVDLICDLWVKQVQSERILK